MNEKMETIAFCKNCGYKISIDSNFCQKCGCQQDVNTDKEVPNEQPTKSLEEVTNKKSKKNTVVVSVLVVCMFFLGIGFVSILNSEKEISITEANFEEYFEVSYSTSDYVGSEVDSFSGMPFVTIGEVEFEIQITPKKTVKKGNVTIVLQDDLLVGWDCEYSIKTEVNGMSISNGLRIPIEFSPNQTYVKKIKATSLTGVMEPKLHLDVIEASGTIII